MLVDCHRKIYLLSSFYMVLITNGSILLGTFFGRLRRNQSPKKDHWQRESKARDRVNRQVLCGLPLIYCLSV